MPNLKVVDIIQVRIATHPDYQSMGYGSRALELLEKYYEGSLTSLDETNDEMNEEVNTVDEGVITLLLFFVAFYIAAVGVFGDSLSD